LAETHKCKSIEAVEAWVENNQGEWLLNINHVATEQDLEENHYLEEVGQTIDHVAINVLFCPYCGEKLDKTSAGITPSFIHNDYSKW
jgi:NADH pyrophosphatase NudC (nudix superfamily)